MTVSISIQGISMVSLPQSPAYLESLTHLSLHTKRGASITQTPRPETELFPSDERGELQHSRMLKLWLQFLCGAGGEKRERKLHGNVLSVFTCTQHWWKSWKRKRPRWCDSAGSLRPPDCSASQSANTSSATYLIITCFTPLLKANCGSRLELNKAICYYQCTAA